MVELFHSLFDFRVFLVSPTCIGHIMHNQTEMDLKKSSALALNPNQISPWEYARWMDPVNESETIQTSDVAFKRL